MAHPERSARCTATGRYRQRRSPICLLGPIACRTDAGVKTSEFGDALAERFVREAQRRVEAGTLYCGILFFGMVAVKRSD